MRFHTLTAATLVLAASLYGADEKTEDVESVRTTLQDTTQSLDINASKTQSLEGMFKNAKVSGQLRAIYAAHNYKNSDNTHATSVGGELRYELADYKGFNGGVAFTTANDIDSLSGRGVNHNNELSSTKGNYTEATQAYVNYKKEGLNLRAGRQLIDTPLADSDDIRMINNTFEAYIATYALDKLTFTVGNLQKWQGYDATLDDGWKKTGEKGTWLASAAFGNENIEACFWYYDITKRLDAYYAEASYTYASSNDLSVKTALQTLIEKEQNGSNEAADIYGIQAEGTFHGLGVNVSYNKAIVGRGKQTFSGFGGGTLVTSMDTMILDNIATDRNAQALVSGVSYEYQAYTVFYAYGNFTGDKNSSGVKAHIVEQNIGAEYIPNEKFKFSAVYAKEENKQDGTDTGTNFDRVQVTATYNF